jgi:squalene synthase HpnC
MYSSDQIERIDSGYEEAFKLVKKHYENFPVVSFFIPSNIRQDMAIIYWFARTADDFADEGSIESSERITKLFAFEERINYLLNNEPGNNFEAALKNTIISNKLSHNNFFNLLKAFKQDVIKNRYLTFNEVLEYCSCSANPVGRILLELFNIRNEKAFYFSDKICTALQLTNFIQDTEIDFKKGRIYYPKDEMDKFGVTDDMFEMKKNNLNLKMLIEFSVSRVQSLFNEGKGLLEFLSGRFKYEIEWTIRGGEEILNKIRGADFDVFTERPALTKFDHLKIIFNTLIRL